MFKPSFPYFCKAWEANFTGKCLTISTAGAEKEAKWQQVQCYPLQDYINHDEDEAKLDEIDDQGIHCFEVMAAYPNKKSKIAAIFELLGVEEGSAFERLPYDGFGGAFMTSESSKEL